ncbi:MAG TPA: hypothetical protein VH598_03985, partial [Verrucomicrobiae bacterium]|nr:hypothetical protein [Verrucomicrobiae bacterium]
VFLSAAFEEWMRNSLGIPVSPRVKWRHAVFMGGLVLPIVVLHYLTSGVVGLCLVAASSAVLVIWAVFKVGNQPATSVH